MWGTTDTSYSLVHGRPIRPLPKRRLRSRLSDDTNAALFGPPQQPTTPLFYFPYNNYAGDQAIGGASVSSGFGLGQHSTGDNLQDSSDEEDNSNASVSRGVGSGASGASENTPSQPDSYEWSENTNNKKKRKIPTPANPGGSSGGNGGGGGGGGSHSSPGFLPTSSTPTPRNRWKSSGPSQRSPLSTISTGNQGSLRRTGRRYPSSPSVETFTKRPPDRRSSSSDPVTPSKGSRRNGGAVGGVGSPKQTQFTFVCESPVSTSLAFSSASYKSTNSNTPGDGSGYPKPMHTVGTQTSPSISNTNANYPPAPQQPKKKSGQARSATSRRDYALQRRRRQEAAGGGNGNGEIWICEFCEYESIFGEAPEALMRQYEIKDRKERRRLAEKRRLLEKAKQKGKKNSSKNGPSKKGSYGNGVHHGINSGTAPPPPPPSTTDSQGTQSDNTPLASAAHTPALKPQRHSQQVQTEAYLEDTDSHVSGGRGANGTCGAGAGAKNGGGGGTSLGPS